MREKYRKVYSDNPCNTSPNAVYLKVSSEITNYKACLFRRDLWVRLTFTFLLHLCRTWGANWAIHRPALQQDSDKEKTNNTAHNTLILLWKSQRRQFIKCKHMRKPPENRFIIITTSTGTFLPFTPWNTSPYFIGEGHEQENICHPKGFPPFLW